MKTYDQIYPYLTPKALEGLQTLKQAGIEDRDLAMTLLEKILPDEEMYDLDTE